MYTSDLSFLEQLEESQSLLKQTEMLALQKDKEHCCVLFQRR